MDIKTEHDASEMEEIVQKPLKCKYCADLIENEDFLECHVCHGSVHIKCLRNSSTPGDLLGDVFFEFTCKNCYPPDYLREPESGNNSSLPAEKFVRQHLPWFMIITLTLYNLSMKSRGTSRHGYFHWRNHIVDFIDKNWEHLFETGVRRRKTWIGSVAGALSHFSPDFFTSGQEIFQQAGWWKLTYDSQTPKYIYKLYEQHVQTRAQLRNEKRKFEESVNPPEETFFVNEMIKRPRKSLDSEEDNTTANITCSRTIPYMGRKPRVLKKKPNDLKPSKDSSKRQNKQELQSPLNSVQSHLMDFLAETLSNDDNLQMFNNMPSDQVLPNINHEEFLSLPEMHNENAITALESSLKRQEEIPVQMQHSDVVRTSSKATSSFPTATKETGHSSEENNDNNNADDDDDNDNDDEDDDDDEFQPRIIEVIHFQQSEKTPIMHAGLDDHLDRTTRISNELDSNSEDEEIARNRSDSSDFKGFDDAKEEEAAPILLPPCKPSLFTVRKRRVWPWLLQQQDHQQEETANAENENSSNRNLTMMSVYEEKELLLKLRTIFEHETSANLQIPTYIRRFYRKLCVRDWKRKHGKPIFDFDSDLESPRGIKEENSKSNKSNIIDRYQLTSSSNAVQKKSFYARLAGSVEYEFFQSPYTQRILHPIIYRSSESFPPWLKLMCEVKYAVNGTPPTRATIDYVYVRPNHIAAVNALLQMLFWPGIDMSECLSYPDYSVVALYKNLVVGCGFLVPDIHYNEAYVSFMAVRPGWQHGGIGTFMLYHLIQTCLTKDITLHVSVSNPAIILYQKFGFKIEEVILNFYEKYLPVESKQSRNAFFLRLAR